MAKKKPLLPGLSAELTAVTSKRVLVRPSASDASLVDVIVGRTKVFTATKADARLLVTGFIAGVKLGMALGGKKK